MTEWIAAIGALRFRLTATEGGFAPDCLGEPFLVMQDGTEVQIVRLRHAAFLLIDHRAAREEPSRIEYWSASTVTEGMRVAGLVVLADSRRAPVSRGSAWGPPRSYSDFCSRVLKTFEAADAKRIGSAATVFQR